MAWCLSQQVTGMKTALNLQNKCFPYTFFASVHFCVGVCHLFTCSLTDHTPSLLEIQIYVCRGNHSADTTLRRRFVKYTPQ